MLLPPNRRELLGDKLHVTVILRLLLGRQGRLEHGEVVDVNGNSQGRFQDWRGMTSTLRRWIASRERDLPVSPPPPEHL